MFKSKTVQFGDMQWPWQFKFVMYRPIRVDWV